MLNHIKYKTYFVFACFNAAAAIHMFFAAHKTKCRTLEEMDDVFDSGLPPWKTSKVTSSRLEQLAEEIGKGDKVREAEVEYFEPAFTTPPLAVLRSEPEKQV